MKLYFLPNFIGSIVVLFLGGLSFLKNRKLLENKLFFLFSICCFLWLFFYGLNYFHSDQNLSEYYLKIGYTGVIFITILIYHFTVIFFGIFHREKKLVISSYIIGFLFLISLWFSSLFVDICGYKYFWGYYPKASVLHPLYMSFVSFLIFRTTYFYYYFLKYGKLSLLKSHQTKYLFLGFGIFVLAGLDFLQNYGVEFYPIGFFFVLLYTLLTSYAIIKHRLLDIRIAITRVTIFIVVYFFVLGIPFLIGYISKSWLFSTSIAIVFASFGPFIYDKLRRQTERLFLIEQIKYQ
ncbi:MAG: hypothetical protein NC935_07335, partial [Candidatus Omnitrophica bacterium]|nr:hypothetical protein [Candidatus Omnitrophota bacterium]